MPQTARRLRLTESDKRVLFHALNLAIRDKLAGMEIHDDDTAPSEVNAEIRADVATFRALLKRIDDSIRDR